MTLGHSHGLLPTGQEAFSWGQAPSLFSPQPDGHHSLFADRQAYCLYIPMQERI
jgi:hypothetical protein